MSGEGRRLYIDVERWQHSMECPDCGAAVFDRYRHDAWHAETDSDPKEES